jgi:fido (protein-threonine AMPylation protein)
MMTALPLTSRCPEWTDEIPAGRIAEFVAIVGQVADALQTSARSTVLGPEDPCRWHRSIFRNFVPLDCYAGNCRSSSSQHPCLAVNVHVAGIPGSAFQTVQQDLDSLFADARKRLAVLEINWPLVSPKERTLSLAVVTANLVGGFIRVHPFVNGNGRISRLIWAWCLFRFGVPKQFSLHPRPAQPYGQLMAQAMVGNFNPLALAVLDHLARNAPAQA